MTFAYLNTPQEDPVVGLVGPLVLATRGPDGSGEVMLSIRGGREAYLAWSEAPLPSGTQVLVIDIRSARTVDVVPWTENFSVD
jgi:hypothetical protein